MIFRARTQSIVMTASLCALLAGFHETAAVRWSGETIRKGVGLVGIGIAASGVLKLYHFKLCSGFVRIVGGLAIAGGGVCSDIICQRALMLLRRRQAQTEAQQRTGGRGFFEGLEARAGIFCDELDQGLRAVGNAAVGDMHLSNGWHRIKRADLGGVVEVYDGIYNKTRYMCRRAFIA